jgi:hypothetical protein
MLPTAAFADGTWGDVNCNLNPTAPQCTIVVIDSGSGGDSGGNGPLTCRIGGDVVPCYSTYGWLGADGCYYGKDSGNFLPTYEYIKTCYDPATHNFVSNGTALLLDPPATLAIMAQRAVSQLNIPTPVIASNPGLDKPQVRYVPVWWWVQPDLWQTHTATASLPDITITAQATPTTITWYAGDHTSTQCTGPGTPWTDTAAPTSASPTCGHTYTTTSRTNPGGKFHLRAVVTWNITWSGGGFNGTEPTATTAADADIEVTELRSVITG